METRRYRVTGQVQGVGFRWFTRNEALKLGVSGSVRNAADGSVEVVARAPAETLTAFEAVLRDGPPAARVDELRAMKTPPDRQAAEGDTDPEAGFSIER